MLCTRHSGFGPGSLPMKKILNFLIFIIFLTQSMDIVANLKLGGFNVRLCYLAAFAFVFLFIVSHKNGFNIRFLGKGFFLVWVCFLIAFAGNTQLLSRNIGYLMWLAFNVLMMWAIYHYSSFHSPENVMRVYITTSFIMACYGIAQFVLSGFGLNLFVTMWWKPGILPRVNALSYEPSYFASYLLIAFVFLYFASRRKLFLFKPGTQWLMLGSIILAILLSTSRMGILFMVSILVFDYLKMLFYSAIRLKISRINLLVTSVFLAGLFAVFVAALGNEESRHRYLAGTGLDATSGSHSKDTRLMQMNNTLSVFLKSPWIGYSLGGIAPAIAEYYRVRTTDQKRAKEYEGLNIFLEVLAASGIVGFLFFAGWLIVYFRCQNGMAGLLRENGYTQDALLLDCLKYALITELLILMMSQNILRPYLWMVFGLGNALYFRYKDLIFKRQAATLQQ